MITKPCSSLSVPGEAVMKNAIHFLFLVAFSSSLLLVSGISTAYEVDIVFYPYPQVQNRTHLYEMIAEAVTMSSVLLSHQGLRQTHPVALIGRLIGGKTPLVISTLSH